MNKIMRCAIVLGILALHPIDGADDASTLSSGGRLTSDYSLKDPFNPKELRALTEKPSSNHRRLMLLILRAGIEKDNSFQDLLGKRELRKSKDVFGSLRL